MATPPEIELLGLLDEENDVPRLMAYAWSLGVDARDLHDLVVRTFQEVLRGHHRHHFAGHLSLHAALCAALQDVLAAQRGASRGSAGGIS